MYIAHLIKFDWRFSPLPPEKHIYGRWIKIMWCMEPPEVGGLVIGGRLLQERDWNSPTEDKGI
jgi:hypothetical protein